MAAARRCDPCSTNWPNDQIYVRCPTCARQTSVKEIQNINAILTMEDAKRIASYAKFEEWLQKETLDERLARRKRFKQAQVDEEQASEAEAARIKEDFHRVLDEGAFSTEEYEVLLELEAQLPMSHQRKNGVR